LTSLKATFDKYPYGLKKATVNGRFRAMDGAKTQEQEEGWAAESGIRKENRGRNAGLHRRPRCQRMPKTKKPPVGEAFCQAGT
jgi:hypothetical protein